MIVCCVIVKNGNYYGVSWVWYCDSFFIVYRLFWLFGGGEDNLRYVVC